MIVKHSKLAEHNLLIKLGSHFKVKKEDLNKAKGYVISGTDKVESPVLTFDYLPNGITITDAFYPVEVSGLNLVTLLDHPTFLKSKLHEAFEGGEAYLDPKRAGSFKMAIYVTGMVWLVYRESAYTGVGGIYISDKDYRNGFVIEPLKNYLNDKWPKPELD